MKTLCFSLGLLLLTVCCCNAGSKAVEFNAPGSCCFSFMTRPLPLKRISGISMTHSSCPRPAFIVETVTGRQICYSQTFQWAQNVYRLQSTEGSGQQQRTSTIV